MLKGTFFSILDELARHARSNGRPFGGLQLVLTGDFFQLPPVGGGFVFLTPTWTTCSFSTFKLSRVC